MNKYEQVDEEFNKFFDIASGSYDGFYFCERCESIRSVCFHKGTKELKKNLKFFIHAQIDKAKERGRREAVEEILKELQDGVREVQQEIEWFTVPLVMDWKVGDRWGQLKKV